MACTPTPRLRVGFQASAWPVAGSMAPMPGRDTAPGPADLWPYGLFSHCSCPPTYTAAPVTATPNSELPPVRLTQRGWCAPVPAASKRAAESHRLFGLESSPVV